jgi:hypothetical protein
MAQLEFCCMQVNAPNAIGQGVSFLPFIVRLEASKDQVCNAKLVGA